MPLPVSKGRHYTVFVHRSFQEYFCAFFLANYHGQQIRPMLDKLASRVHDEVISMLFEMARDKVDREWIVPHIDEVIEEMAVSDLGGTLFLFNLLLPNFNVAVTR